MRRFIVSISMGIAGLALIWLGGRFGWWWVAFVVGVVIGLALRPARLALAVALLAGGLGWGLPLAILAFREPVGRIAAAVESVIGMTSTGGAAIIVLTILLGCVLGVLGAWVGIAARLLPGTARA